MTIWQPVECWTSKVICAQAQARARAPTPTYVRTRTRARAHTQTLKYVIFIAFPRQQRFRECASMLSYTCIASLLGYLSGITTLSKMT
jgi:hypothetical protein